MYSLVALSDPGSIHFRSVSPRLEKDDALKCSFDNFPWTLRYLVIMEKFHNFILIILLKQLCAVQNKSIYLLNFVLQNMYTIEVEKWDNTTLVSNLGETRLKKYEKKKSKILSSVTYLLTKKNCLHLHQ